MKKERVYIELTNFTRFKKGTSSWINPPPFKAWTTLAGLHHR